MVSDFGAGIFAGAVRAGFQPLLRIADTELRHNQFGLKQSPTIPYLLAMLPLGGVVSIDSKSSCDAIK